MKIKTLLLLLTIISLSIAKREFDYDDEEDEDDDDEEDFGQCGGKFGDCGGMMECCSKFGFCGIMDIHCHLSKGCQPQYGRCREEDDNYDPKREVQEWHLTKDGKCGPANGECPIGQCCSKEGECGTTDDHCLVTKGCRSLFGDCKDDSASFDDSKLPPEEIPENKGERKNPGGKKMKSKETNEKIIWDYLNEKLGNKYAVAGLMGCMYSHVKLIVLDFFKG